MADDLNPDNEQFIDAAVHAGQYQGREDALNEAVDLLRRRDRLVNDVNAGIHQLKNGESTSLNSDEELNQFMNDVNARGRERLAKKRNGQ